MKKLILFLVIQIIVFQGIAQKVINLSGTIMDSASRAVSGANIHLLNSNASAVTDFKGSFTLKNVFHGDYTVEISALGYAAKTQKITVGDHGEDVTFILSKAPAVLDEVIVTAQKTEELLQEVPVSVTSLSSRQVEEYRLWNSREMTAIVPNFYSADPGDRRNVSAIRGITTTSYDPAVATYIDGVNQFNLDTYIAQLFDVERIEVLRGPQGTLYGRNAMGGVINIITKQPNNRVNGFGEVSFGNYGLQRYMAGVRSPIVKDKLFFGIAALYDRSNGFYTNEFNNRKYDKQNSLTGNYYLKFLPSQKWAFTLNVKHNNNRNNGPFPLVYGDEAFANPYKLNQNALTKLVDNIFNASLSANYFGKAINISSQTAYQSNYRIYEDPIDADFSPIDGITLINNYGKDWNKVEVLTQEFKFSSPALEKRKFKWTAGTYLFHQNNPVKQTTRFGEDAAFIDSNIQKNSSLISSTRTKSNGIAFYGQGTYKFTDRFSITAGLRYDYENKKQSVLGQYQADPDPEPIFDFRSDTSASAHYQAVSPKFTAVYQLDRQSMLFLTYSKGYRAGGLTSLSSDPSFPALYSYKPEFSNNYEAGIKNTFFNKRLLFNITAFYSRVNDAQVPTLVLPDAVIITRNTGKLTSKGVEVETSGLFSGFQFDYNLGFADASFSNLKIAQNGTEVNLKGKTQIFTPDITSMLAAQYNIIVSPKHNFRLSARGEWRYLGKQYFDLANTIEQPSYNLFNARLEARYANFSLIVWGRNLAGKKYISYAYDFGAVHLGDPKTFGVTAAYKF